MAACSFFGHRDSPESLYPVLKETVREIIRSGLATVFYMGTQGNFDAMAYCAVKELLAAYPSVIVYRVLPYLPKTEIGDSILPKGIETVPPRYAISWRNKWLLDHSAMIVSYITHSYGGAAQAVRQAEKQGAPIIRISPLCNSDKYDGKSLGIQFELYML